MNILIDYFLIDLFINKVNEKVREKLFSLRQTWVDIFPATKMYALDIKVNCIDPGWPILAKLPPARSPAIHVNPNFLIAKVRILFVRFFYKFT